MQHLSVMEGGSTPLCSVLTHRLAVLRESDTVALLSDGYFLVETGNWQSGSTGTY